MDDWKERTPAEVLEAKIEHYIDQLASGTYKLDLKINFRVIKNFLQRAPYIEPAKRKAGIDFAKKTFLDTLATKICRSLSCKKNKKKIKALLEEYCDVALKEILGKKSNP